MFNKTIPGDVFNIATGEGTSIIEIANFINLYCKNKNKILFKPRRDWDSVLHRKANIEKISRLLNYSSNTKIKDGIKQTCDWLIKNT